MYDQGRRMKDILSTPANDHRVTVSLHKLVTDSFEDTPRDVVTDELPEWVKSGQPDVPM